MLRSRDSLNERRRRSSQIDAWLTINAETVDANFASSYSVV
jgi:deferrochelatase/peroxidase EfeB